ncbi:MAG TPA: prolyl oligopeptidase family serine peptidase [Tepidisphaeraceae bacterium]|jgi:predicted esterase
MRTLVSVLLLTFVTTARAAQLSDFEPRQYKDADGNVLLYRLYKPKNYDASKAYPLILFLHGAGERGDNNAAQVRDALHWAKDSVQNEHPCFILAPQCPAVRPMFQVYGTAKGLNADYNDYAQSGAGQWKHYKIELAKLPTGAKHYLSFTNAAAAKATAPPVGEFRNLTIYEASVPHDQGHIDLRKLDFSKRMGKGTLAVSDDGTTLTLTGDLRAKAAFEYTVTPHSVLEFDFRSSAQGLTHAIALDTDDFFDYRWANMDWAAKKGSMGKEPSTPMRLALEVLDQLRKEFKLDDKRLYITGLSMGGYGTWDVIARHPTLFAAAVPVCGGADESTAPTIKDIPIWCFHGGADPTVPTARSRNMIKALEAAGGQPKYTEYPGVGHNSWDKAYSEPELPKWLFAQHK